MNTIKAEMPMPVNTAKGSAASKAEKDSDSGQFGEIMKTQQERNQESQSAASKKEEQDKAPVKPEENPENIQADTKLPDPSLITEMIIPQIFGEIVNMVSPQDSIPEPQIMQAAVTAADTVPEQKTQEPAESRTEVPAENAAVVTVAAKNSEDSSAGFNIQDLQMQDSKKVPAEMPRDEVIQQNTAAEALPKANGAVQEQAAETAGMDKEHGIPKAEAVKTEKPKDTSDKSGEYHMLQSAVRSNTAENTQAAGSTAAHPETHKADIHPEYMERLKADIADSLAKGKHEFEIQLNPANLGKMVIKASYEAGKSIISVVCSEARTMEAMSHQARELAAMVEERTGNETVVVVEHPAKDYLQQESQQKNQQESHSNKQQNENKKSQFHENFDFLQQLRLGLA